jgi:very-short-patch-repair endonuclease
MRFLKSLLAPPAPQGRSMGRPVSRRRREAVDSLGSLLRSRDLRPWRFRRQHSLGPFVVDFACIEQALVIEVAAEPAGVAQRERRNLLERLGYRVLSFPAAEVLDHPRSVLRAIAGQLE